LYLRVLLDLQIKAAFNPSFTVIDGVEANRVELGLHSSTLENIQVAKTRRVIQIRYVADGGPSTV